MVEVHDGWTIIARFALHANENERRFVLGRLFTISNEL